MNAKPPPIPLAHAKRPPWDRRPWARRVERVLWSLLLLLPIGCAFSLGYERLWIAAEMRYRAPRDTVVYDDDRQNAPLLVGTGKYQYLTGRFVNTGPRPSPAVWVARPLGSMGEDWPGICFLHRRHTRAGAARLVTVFFQTFEERDAGYRLNVVYGSSIPAAWPQDGNGYAEGQVTIDVPAGARLRIFAGDPHEADESHFRIRYELSGRPGTECKNGTFLI